MAEKSQKRGLGLGLGALFGEDSLEKELTGALNVPIEKIEPREGQPRSNFDKEALEELADSIAQFGLIQPITVRKLEGGYFQIIAGERRWRASRMAGLKEVPVRVIKADDKRAMEIALVENLQREDLNPIEEAKGYQTLIKEYGMTQEEASESVGKSRPAVTNALRLLTLTPPVMALVEDGDISAGHGRALLAIKDEAMQLRMATRACEEGLSVRQVESLSAKVATEASKPTETEKLPEITVKVNYLADAEKRLGNALGRRVTMKDGKKMGKIELEYYGSDDRESLIDVLLTLGRDGGLTP